MKIVIDGLFYRQGKKVKKLNTTSHHKPKQHILPYNRTFPSLNDFIEEGAKGHLPRNNMKKKYQNIACLFIRKQAHEQIKGRVFMYYTFFEKDKKRDPSNIASFFIKVFEDALQDCEVIGNDGWNIAGYSCFFSVDRKNPRVEVIIEPLDDIQTQTPDEGEEEEENGSDGEDDGEESG